MRRLVRSAMLFISILMTVLSTPIQAGSVNTSFEQQVIDLVNEIRLGLNLSQLGQDYRLRDAALAHSMDMAITPCFQHESCDGTSFETRVWSYYPQPSGIGENIAAGQVTPQQVVTDWMNSPGHKANIENPIWNGIGVGYYFEEASPFDHYWTQNFGTLPPLAGPQSLNRIDYEVVSLGGNQYRYIYSVVNNGAFANGAAIGLFDILFDPDLYLETSLSIVTDAGIASEWVELILDSGAGVPAAYDVLAMLDGVTVGQTVTGFAVEFEWLGAGAPGAQAYEIYDPTTYALLATGMTTPVPEPKVIWMMLAALALIAALGRRRAFAWA